MAGLWHLSHHQLHDLNGKPYPGAKAYFTRAETLSPLTVYKDASLASTHPSPVEADGFGIFPPVFLDEADGFYRMRVTTKNGVGIAGSDVISIPIVGPSGEGGGSEVPVDPNSLLKTGDTLWVPVTGTRSGFVRANARTIGSSTSGASERANSDTEALYLYLWATYADTICPVTGGRGGSAAADWAGNKPIGLLDLRGRGPFGVADMGNTDSGRLNAAVVTTGGPTVAASVGGEDRHTLTTGELAANIPNSAISTSVSAATPTGVTGGISGVNVQSGVLPVPSSVQAIGVNTTTTTTVTINPSGGSPHNTMSPFMLGTWFLRL